MKFESKTLVFAMAAVTASATALATSDVAVDNVIIGADNNSAENAFIQPQDPALSGGGRDQTMQFGDLLDGTGKDDLIIGRLGVDFINGRGGDDVMIGGIEHFNPLNRDRAFGRSGNDIFIWKPGDGSDTYLGGPGYDAIVFGVTGERVNGQRVFEVVNDQKAGNVAINPNTRLPKVDVTNSPGFCEVIDKSTSPDARKELRALGLTHLVRFFIRAVADQFEMGGSPDDNGLRVTLHLQGVETVVCTNRNSAQVEVLDLTKSPPQVISLNDVRPRKLRQRLRRIVK